MEDIYYCPACSSEIEVNSGDCRECGEKLVWEKGQPVSLLEHAKKSRYRWATSGCLAIILFAVVLFIVLFLIPYE